MLKPYNGEKPYIFFSYAHDDGDIVLPIIGKIMGKHRVWFDQGIRFGREWDKEIADKIKGATVFVFMITEKSLRSANCLDEVCFAKDNGILFVNALVKDIVLPSDFLFRYGRYHMWRLFEYADIEEALANLGERCEELRLTAKEEDEGLSPPPRGFARE